MLKKQNKKLKTPHTKQKLLELINSGNLQDIKSISKIQLHFYTLTMKYQKDQKNNLIYNCIKKNTIPQNKLN